MKNAYLLAIGLTVSTASTSAFGQATWTSLSTFGSSGYLAPGSSGLAAAGSSANRGLAFASGNLYYASASQVFEIDPNTGALIGGLSTTGVTGGTFAVDQLAAGSDGTLYAGNLTTAATTPFKVYSYATPTSLATTPTVVYNANPQGGSTRLGDTFTAIGGGGSITFAAGSGAAASGYTVINGGVGTPVAVGPVNGFNRGLTFVNPTQVIGLGTAVGGGTYYNTTTGGTLLGTVSIPDPNGNTADRILSYNVLGPQALLAVQSTGDSHVTLYDATNPNGPLYLGTLNLNPTLGVGQSNGNGTGQMAWGPATYNPVTGQWTENLYALSTGQGIQAFVVTVPEPATMSLLALGGLAVVAFRKKLQK